MCLWQRHPDHQLTRPGCCTISTMNVSLLAGHPHKRTPATVTTSDIDTRPRAQLLAQLSSRNLTECQLFRSGFLLLLVVLLLALPIAEQPVVWVAEPLDLISAAPKWIRKETGAHTSRNYVTFPPDRLLTLSPRWRAHGSTHEYTRQKGGKARQGDWAGERRGCFVIRWFLHCNFNWFFAAAAVAAQRET